MLRYVESVFLCLREDLKEKSGRLRNFCLPVSPSYFLFFFLFFNGPGQTVMCSLYILIYLKISERKLYPKVYNIFFEDRHRKANDNLFATNCNWLQLTTLHLKKNRQTWPRKADESVVRIEDNRSPSIGSGGQLFHILDKLTFSAWKL